MLDDPTSEWPWGTGEMAVRIRTLDWAKTPLGPIASWPQSLRTATDMMLAMPSAATGWASLSDLRSASRAASASSDKSWRNRTSSATADTRTTANTKSRGQRPGEPAGRPLAAVEGPDAIGCCDMGGRVIEICRPSAFG